MVILGFGDLEMSANATLQEAKRKKRDEFYTQLTDIEKELRHFKKHFKNKAIYCNCDDPYESNFFKYFAAQFNILELKRLMATSYEDSPILGKQLPSDDLAGLEQHGTVSHKIDLRSVDDFDGDGGISLNDVEHLLRNDANAVAPLYGNDDFASGDFRSEECLDLLKEADVVITNPPFSLFREFVDQLMEHRKKFLILGSMNAITYKEIFPLLQTGMMWLGVNNGAKQFAVPRDYRHVKTTEVKGQRLTNIGNVVWYTNLDYRKRHEDITLYKKYSAEKYPHYDNYDAIEVRRVAEIPIDYNGKMGVPITFLAKHNPSQFEIVGLDRPLITEQTGKVSRFRLDGKELYARIVIRRKE